MGTIVEAATVEKQDEKAIFNLDRSIYDEANEENLIFTTEFGVNEHVVRTISQEKNEPYWMLQKRLQAYNYFVQRPMPTFGPDLSKLDLQKIRYFAKTGAKESNTWEEVPEDIKRTFEKLGIPEAERTVLAGVGAQYESDVVYHNLKDEWAKKGVIFENMDVAIEKYPELVKKYFMTTCVSLNDHKFAALHGAVWSGGTFIYVPPHVKVTIPLQAYFRMNAKSMGQFEHTLIIADEGAEVFYIEGCSAPVYKAESLHAGCVEIFVGKNARVRYSSVENWSKNTYNLNTKRAIVDENGCIEWIGGNMGCLTGDTLISTNPKGPTKISQLQVGDTVFALDKKENRIKRAVVKALVYSGEKEVFNVEVAGRTIKASANHPFLALEHIVVPANKRKGKFLSQWKSLEQLKKGDLIAIAKKLPEYGIPYALPTMTGYKNKQYNGRNQYGATFTITREHLFKDYIFPTETTEDFMWFLGVLIGDGHVWLDKKHGAKINIAIPETCDLREPLIKTIKTLFHYDVTYQKDRFIIINAKPIAEFIKKIEFAGTAGTKSLPRWIHMLPQDQKLAFLGGYFDSDGHVNDHGVYITSINKGLLEDVKELALSCGIGFSRIFSHRKPGKVTILGKECNAQASYRILLNGPNVSMIKTRSPSCVDAFRHFVTRRDYSSAHGLNFGRLVNDDVGYARIENITSQGIKPTYDIEVENHHNFVANGIIVHNSGVTMLYPASILRGKGARAEHTSIAFAGAGQHQDTGAKVIMLAPETSCVIKAKSISKAGGITNYRGLLTINKGAVNAKAHVVCDALILDAISKSDTTPNMQIREQRVDVGHEATVGRISDEKLFYLMSRGLTEDEAMKLVVSGFIEPIVKELPVEYAVELNRLIELELEGVG